MFIIMRYSEICDGSYDVYSSGYSSKQQIVGYAESKQECLEWINNTTNGMMDFTEIQFVEDNYFACAFCVVCAEHQNSLVAQHKRV